MGFYLVDNVVGLNRRMIGARRWVSAILCCSGGENLYRLTLARMIGYFQEVC